MNKLIYDVSRALTRFGGALLTLIAVMSMSSIIGRASSIDGLGPVQGDFELAAAGTALAVFCSLPWAHLRYTHATVDLLWGHYPGCLQRLLGLQRQPADVAGLVPAGLAHGHRHGRLPRQRRGHLHPAVPGPVGLCADRRTCTVRLVAATLAAVDPAALPDWARRLSIGLVGS